VVPDLPPGEGGGEIPVAREVAVAVVPRISGGGSDELRPAPEREMAGIPARPGRRAAGPFQGLKPGMTDERGRCGREQRVPLGAPHLAYGRQNAYIRRAHGVPAYRASALGAIVTRLCGAGCDCTALVITL